MNNRSLNKAPFYKCPHAYMLVTSFENVSPLSCSGALSAVPDDTEFLASEWDSLLKIACYQLTRAHQRLLQPVTITALALLPSQFSSSISFSPHLVSYSLLQIAGHCLVFIGNFSLLFFLTNLFMCFYLFCHIVSIMFMKCMQTFMFDNLKTMF